MAALYWIGISIRAARAKAASLSAGLIFFAIIAVKLTNCIPKWDVKTYTKVTGWAKQQPAF